MDVIHTSSATIRNDMKALEDAGLLVKAHTSSGRIPSIDGYRYYVENFLKPDAISQQKLYQVMKSFDHDYYQLHELFETAATVLSQLTGFTSVVLNVPLKEQVLTNFELVKVDTHSALALVTFNTGEIRTSQFLIPTTMTWDELQVIKTIVDDRLLGKKMLEVNYALRTEIPQVMQKYFVVTSGAIELFDHIFQEVLKERASLVGTENILTYQDVDIVEVYKLLSNQDRVIHEIREIDEPETMRKVKFTPELNLTYVTQKFLIPYRGFGTIAIAGPIDIDYQKVASYMDLVAKVLTMKLTDYYRYLDGNHYEIRR
jgi:heat-inducible transcriptional repressor